MSTNKTILVTGGAGYIGSIAVKDLIDKGNKVIIVDNLSTGKQDHVNSKAKFYKVDIVDINELESVFKENKIDFIMHFAGYKIVPESMKDAAKYSDTLIGTINILKCMVKYNVKKIIYSSSAAVYGLPSENIVTENTPAKPISYYGELKLQCEKNIEWFSKVHGLQYVIFRYFNVAGDVLGFVDFDAMNVLPLIIKAIINKSKFTIFGKNYDTRDGTCIRDYIHVQDLVDAHISSLDLDQNEIINLGTKSGTTVLELVNTTLKVTNEQLDFEIGDARENDAGAFIATNEKAKDLLSWTPKHNVEEMILSTYNAYCREYKK